MAQGLHRLDMRLKLGSLRDTAAAQRQAAAEAEVRKHKPTMPTVLNAADTKAAQEAEAKAKAAAEEAAKPHHIRVRPLSESKAIESGANFISETFLFLVAGSLILFESWRSRNKESTRREGVEGRLVELEQSEQAARVALVALEKELLQLRAKYGDTSKLPAQRILSRDIYEKAPDPELPQAPQGWLSRIYSYFSFGQSAETTTEPTPNTPSTTGKTTTKPDGSVASVSQTQSSA